MRGGHRTIKSDLRYNLKEVEFKRNESGGVILLSQVKGQGKVFLLLFSIHAVLKYLYMEPKEPVAMKMEMKIYEKKKRKEKKTDRKRFKTQMKETVLPLRTAGYAESPSERQNAK